MNYLYVIKKMEEVKITNKQKLIYLNNILELLFKTPSQYFLNLIYGLLHDIKINKKEQKLIFNKIDTFCMLKYKIETKEELNELLNINDDIITKIFDLKWFICNHKHLIHLNNIT